MFGRKQKNKIEGIKILRCYQEGLKNGWASGTFAIQDGDFITEEDRLNKNSISFINTKRELKKFFRQGNWCLGQGIIYKNLFFLQQINGGDEWATYHIKEDEIKQFESITFEHIIKRGEFESYIKKINNINYKI